ncbi:MAG: bifunctional hydroxymethylpyrimidine kinase/phosphomethylpyrimidine kinase [Bacteroidales bacterium]|nr:bifunctional hydroxymethylpyrimidine kinase/phosphomethylpyrimidine kinase [Bacteroidales bacterium]
MRTKMRYRVACTIAGSDSGGGAGIQADLKTFSALGVFGTSVITAITAQNTLGVTGIEAVTPDILSKQLSAVFDDLQPDAVKIGMIHNVEAARVVYRFLASFPVVLDPVMIAESGAKLIEDETIEYIKTKLFRCVSIITPNIPEAETLTGMKITDRATLVANARMLIEQGAPAVLLKGGHLAGDEKHDCLLIRNHEPVILSHPTVATDNTHGTGCTLSSAIAAYLALGEELTTAVKKATDYLQQALQAGANIKIGHGNGPVNHFFNPQPLKIFEP